MPTTLAGLASEGTLGYHHTPVHRSGFELNGMIKRYIQPAESPI